MDAERTGFPVGEVTNQVNIIFKACHNLLRWQENAPTGPKEKENGELARKYLREQYEGMFDAWQFIEVFATRAPAAKDEHADTKTNTKASDSKKNPPSQHHENPQGHLQPTRIIIDDENIILDGKAIALELTKERRTDAMAFLRALSREWQSRPDIVKLQPSLEGIRLDRLRHALPKGIQEAILSNRRKGYRLA